jgi:ribosome-associated protein
MTDNQEESGDVSKTRRKKQMTGLQKLGEELLDLNKKQLDQIDVPEPLLSALKEYQRLPNRHEAKRRQLQFIGKLMRGSDHERIRAALEKMRTPDRQEVRRGQEIESWGQRLLEGSESEVQLFLEAYSLAERQPLRQLLRNYAHAAGDQSDSFPAEDAEHESVDYVSEPSGSEDSSGNVNPAARIQRRRLLDYIKTCIN